MRPTSGAPLTAASQWGRTVSDTNVAATPARAEIHVDKDGHGRISRTETLSALDHAVDMAQYHAKHQHEPSVICLDGHGQMVVTTEGNTRYDETIILRVDKTGKLPHRSSIGLLQGELNLRLAGVSTFDRILKPQLVADSRAASTDVATVNDVVAVRGTRVVPGAAEAIANSAKTPVSVTGTAHALPIDPRLALAFAFGVKKDTEALAYLDALDKLPHTRALAAKLNDMLLCDYNAKGTQKDKDINAYLLVKSALHDILFPANIGQEAVGSCAATVEQITLAHDHPERYLNLVHDLAGAEQSVLPNGATMKANFSYLTPTKKNEERSLTACLVQNAIMAYGKDKPTYDSDDDGDDGLTDDQIKRVHDGLFPDDHVTFAGKEAGWHGLARAVGEGRYVSTGMHYSDSGRDSLHQVLVTGMTRQAVTYINPWGRLETMPLAKFRKRVDTVAVPMKLPAKAY